MEWCEFATRLDGPPGKQGYPALGISFSAKRGEVKHSAVGSWAGMQGVLANHPENSWHFSVLKDGRVFQHYGLSACCYHANDSDPDGGVRANIDLVGIEHEGGPPGNESEPLTEAQLQSTVRLTEWCAAQSGYRVFGLYPFQELVWTMAEHNQVGNAPTACPSGRIPWEVIAAALVPIPILVPTFAEQLDADNAMDARILAYQFGRPLPPMSARQVEVYDWLSKQPKQ